MGHSKEDVSTPFTDKNCAVSQEELVSEDVLDVLNIYVRGNATVNGTSLLYWKAVENDLSFTSEKPNLPYAITNKSGILTVASKAKPGTSVEITVGDLPPFVKSVKIMVNDSILKANEEGKYIFTMPEKKVTVDAQMELNLTKLEDGRYAISTAEELAIFAKAVNSGIFREEKAALTADIKASTEDGFEPIGTKSNPYGGSFYGDGHTLTLDITEGTPYNETTATGLFGVTNNANVYDLILKGSVDGGTDTNSYTGALIGAIDSRDTYVYNVYSEATVSGCGYVGGIIGRGDVFAGLRIVVNNGKVVQKDSSDDKKAVGAILGTGGTSHQNVYFNSEKNSGMFDRGYYPSLNKVEQNSDACVPITEEEFFTDNMMDRLNTSVYSNQNNGMKLKFWDISPDEKTVKFATDCPAPLYDISPGNSISSQCIDAPGNSRSGKTITVKLASDIDLGEGIKGILGIRVTNAKGDVIEIQETDDNTYKFTMPEEEVYIWVLCEYDIETDDDGVYCIENEKDLITFAQIVEGGQPEANAKVMAESMSIEKISESVSESDGLIGQNTAYKGTFDGNNAPIVWYDALFGKTDGAVIKNMNISTAVTKRSAGLVVSAKDTRIDHCDVRIDAQSTVLGGIVYSADGCKITNCSVTAAGFVYVFGGIAFMPSDTVIANCVLNECDLTAYMYGGIAYATAGNTKIYNCVNQDTFTAGAQVLDFAGAIVGLRQTPDLILENNFFYASNNCMDVVGDIVNGNPVPASAMTDKNSAVSDEDVQALYIPLKLNEYVEKNPDLMAGTTLSKWGNSSDAETGSNAACFADAKHPEICPITQSDIMVDVLVNGSVVYGAGEGAEVTLRDVPSSAKVTVTDKNGNKVEITGQEDTYQFTMPAGAVTVSVVMDSGIKETTEIDGKTYVVVKTAEDFIKAVTSIAQGNNALNVKIAEDIRLTSDILQSYPVYSEETLDYNAIFDGAGHTVTFDGLATSMLPSIGEKGMIKDLTIAGSNSGTAGIAVVALVNKGTIMNCINKVNISGELAAGFVSTNRGTICNCINKGDMNGSNLSVAIAGINQGTVSFVANEGTLGDASVGKGLIANGNEVKNSLDLSAEADKSVWAVNAAKFNGALEKEKADSSLYDNCREWSVIETDTSAELVFADEENAAYYMCTTPDGDQAYQVGDTVEVTVDSSSIEEGMKIKSVTAHAQYTDETFDATPVDGKENTFSFIMPGKTCKVEVKQVVEGLIKDEDGYFLVGSLEDLKKVKKNIEYGNDDSDVKLTADIASYDGTPIGGSDGYNGTFDGNGHSITLNMQDNSGDYQYFGLFGTLNSSAVVKNLTIKGSIHAYDSEYVGAVAGKNCGTVADCVNNADIIGVGENKFYGYAGGIVGLTEGGKNSPAKLSNCVNNGDITGYDAGGIVSSALENSAVSNCRNNGTVTATCDDVGGIAAEGYNTEIINCVNTGNLSGEYAGGVVSDCQGNVQVSNCANTGNVCGLDYSGGIVGYGCEAMSI
ncbi:MAG: hypothetical protein MRZ84_10145, partial [Eubacterium sp.]|nr:hypothetical protein [Eubacterium sp.]